VGRPFMTGGINLSPEAERQLNELDDWITKRASADIAQRFVSAILDHNRDHSRVPVCRPSA
jgi:toxin ParE1/3/4